VTDEEREVWRLLHEQGGQREVKRAIPSSQLDAAYAAGWLFVKSLRRGRVQVVKSFAKTLSYEQIAERVGLTTRQVHSRVVSANKKLRSATR
jgi:hypothetical protein